MCFPHIPDRRLRSTAYCGTSCSIPRWHQSLSSVISRRVNKYFQIAILFEFMVAKVLLRRWQQMKVARPVIAWVWSQSMQNRYSYAIYTGRFIMFSVITNIYNKKTKGPTLMELLTSTGKLKKFFWQLDIFDECTTGDTAHIDTLFKLLPHTRQHVEACVAPTWISYRCVPCHPWCTRRISLVVKKKRNLLIFLWLWTISLR